ncbi:MAG: aminoacyl-tRNA hydrolase, partial [Acidobacteriota bacterium]
GQNVNKVATRVTLFFDLEGAKGLAAEHKERIRQRLATRISRDGVLRVACQRHRSQSANRQAAMERLVELLQQALREDAARTPTRPPRAVKEQRLADKRRRADRKRERRVAWEDS